MSRYGYALLSPGGITEEAFLLAMEQEKIAGEKRFTDRSARVETRHEHFDEMLRLLQPGDSVYLCSLTSVAATFPETIEAVRAIEERQAAVQISDLPCAPQEPLHGLLEYFNSTEKALRKNLQQQGYSDARARGQQLGTPLKRPKNYSRCMAALQSGEMTHAEAMKAMGISTSTLYRWLREEKRKEQTVGVR